MKKGILLALVVLLMACSGNTQPRYYQLPMAADTAQGVPATGRHLWVSRVNVADYLAGNGVVYQTNDVEYVTAGSHLWASPLAQQLRQNLLVTLGNALPGTLVAAGQSPGDQDSLDVNVTGFHGRYDGKAIIRGEWLLTHNGEVRRYPFSLALSQPGDGYDALVRTLAKGWQQVGQNIARQWAATQ
ncbi:membrane integrity-associated transporter subunit PqiC [Martelella alba]|uniref:Membrane integrity-associated transporter subunit PqiC n=1 Tax=Martelella alba TaxID=2590451 RepID=A0ABY2SNJ3_9HYPH|nr:membrane integrity-associated transporter subunit PqiC [Martelella alba]TKI07518.1 membrane integrity-associated transporter subunit PqiC [Martelella alba]